MSAVYVTTHVYCNGFGVASLSATIAGATWGELDASQREWVRAQAWQYARTRSASVDPASATFGEYGLPLEGGRTLLLLETVD